MSSAIIPRAACLLNKATKTITESHFQKIIKQSLRQKHVWNRRSKSSIAYAVPRREPPQTFTEEVETSYHFQQVAAPEYEEKFAQTKFKGLETDFPCMTKK